MVQAQLRITVKDDGAVQILYEILPREDASEHELKIAQSLEKSIRAINRKAAEVADLELHEVVIRVKEAQP
jgi:hypothetical protein